MCPRDCQSITIDDEAAVVAGVAGGRNGGRITLTAPLARAHRQGAEVSGSGIELAEPVRQAHPAGAALGSELPTPGAANRYFAGGR